MNIWVGRLNGTKQRIFVRVSYWLVSKEPENFWLWQSLNFTFKMEFLALLSAGGFSEKCRLNAFRFWSIFILHGQSDMICFLSMLVFHNNFIVSSIIIGQVSENILDSFLFP